MEKIKQFIQSEKGKDILIVIIVILVGLSSFELGRLSNKESKAGINIEYPTQLLNQESNAISTVSDIEKQTKNTNVTTKTFFASNRGSKYYSIGCSGGKTIKQENRIYFATKEEAERAGYTLSSSCN